MGTNGSARQLITQLEKRNLDTVLKNVPWPLNFGGRCGGKFTASINMAGSVIICIFKASSTRFQWDF